MSLSFTRAIEHGGLLDQPSTRIEEGHFIFTAPTRTIIALPLDDTGKGLEVVYPESEDYIPRIEFMAMRGGEHRMFTAVATESNGSVKLRIGVTVHAGGYAGSRAEEREDELVDRLLSFEDRKVSSPYPFDSTQALFGLNLSGMEAFIWSTLMRDMRGEFAVDETVIEYAPEVVVAFGTLEPVVDFDEIGTVEVDASGRAEAPGIQLGIVLQREYSEIVWAQSGDVKFKNICNVSRTSTCFGGSDPCTYDDYVFSRAVGQCRPCMTQARMRDKYKVK